MNEPTGLREILVLVIDRNTTRLTRQEVAVQQCGGAAAAEAAMAAEPVNTLGDHCTRRRSASHRSSTVGHQHAITAKST